MREHWRQRRGDHRHLRGCGGPVDLVRHDREPDGVCNPNTIAGDTAGTQLVLAAVLPSSFVPDVVNSASEPTSNSELVVSAEPVSLKPLTVVYTLNPKAVWSDGVPITAADFKYAWEEQRGDPIDVARPTWRSIAGYRDIASVTGTNGGHTVTVGFQTPVRRLGRSCSPTSCRPSDGEGGVEPGLQHGRPGHRPVGRPLHAGACDAEAITLVQNPRWWGTPANPSRSPSTSLSSTAQLAQWMASGYVQVAAPGTVTQSFLTQITGLPGAQSEVDAWRRCCSWTWPVRSTGSSHPISGSPSRSPSTARTWSTSRSAGPSRGSPRATAISSCRASRTTSRPRRGLTTTTIPPATSSTSTTTVGAGGSVNFPVTPVPTQAATFITATGLDRSPGIRLPLGRSAGPSSCTWSTTRPTPGPRRRRRRSRPSWTAGRLHTSVLPVAGATQTGETLAAGFADLAVLPQTFTPYMSQTVGMYTQLLGPTGKNGSQDWTGYSDSKFDQLVTTASEQLNLTTAMGFYTQADTMLWDNMVSLPLFAEPTVLVWSRTIAGVNAEPRSTSLLWFAQYWAVKVPDVDEQHHAVAAGAVGASGSGDVSGLRSPAAADGRPLPARRWADGHALASPDAAVQLQALVGVAVGRRASLRGWCPQGRGGSSPPSDTIKTRLLESNLLVEDVHRRRSVHFHVEVIR